MLRAKFVEQVCVRGEGGTAAAAAAAADSGAAVDAVVETLRQLEPVCPSRERYNELCLMLAADSARLAEHPEFRGWNPHKGRAACFQQVLPLVRDLLGGGERRQQQQDGGSSSAAAAAGVAAGPLVASNDRLLQLLIKGVLYESCVDFCQRRATGGAGGGGAAPDAGLEFSSLLHPPGDSPNFSSGLGDSDLSLLSWLQSIPPDTFACPFEQRSLNVDVRRLRAPRLETSWTEHMLVTPIKPTNVFPHSAMPAAAATSASGRGGVMTKSLNVSALLSTSSHAATSAAAAAAATAATASSSSPGQNGSSVADMSKSLASFHLASSSKAATQSSAAAAATTTNGGNGGVGDGFRSAAMDASVHHLFKEGESITHLEGEEGGGLGDAKGKVEQQQHHHQQQHQMSPQPQIVQVFADDTYWCTSTSLRNHYRVHTTQPILVPL